MELSRVGSTRMNLRENDYGRLPIPDSETDRLLGGEAMDSYALVAPRGPHLASAIISKEGRLEVEPNVNVGALSYLYGSFLGKMVRWVLGSGWLPSWVVGKYYDTALSTHHIKSFVDEYNIDLNEYERQHPSEYTSFNDFFTRRVRLDKRPIDASPEAVCSPADSKLLVIEDITRDKGFLVKGKEFRLERFLNDPILAKEFEHGTLMIFRLSPQDYHRYHFPISGIPSEAKTISGRYDSVNPISYKSGVDVLSENERHLTVLESDDGSSVAMVAVGALGVGRIKETYGPDEKTRKGDEAGYFEFGGSTVALLFKQGAIEPREDFVGNSRCGIETVVKMGETVAKSRIE